MAVESQINPTIQPLAQIDKRFPIGVWSAEASATGDLSGGSLQATIIWSRAAPEQLVSVEQMATAKGSGIAETSHVLINTGERKPGGGSPQWQFALLIDSASANLGCRMTDVGGLQYIVNPSEGQFTIRATIPNANGVVFTLDAWGYIWSVEARNIPPGPLRPQFFLL